MVTEKDRLKNLKFIKDLAKRKNWQVDWAVVKKSVNKLRPRFIYFPFTDNRGEELFFKSCSWGRLALRKRIIKEFKIQKWLGEIRGPVKEVREFGQEGPIFWYTASYLSLDEGIVCLEENVSSIKLEDVAKLAAQVKWLWGIKKDSVPTDLRKYLFISTKDKKVFPKVAKKIKKYLKILEGAFEVSVLDWKKEDEVGVLSFFENLKEEILSFEEGEGLFVHGDLAPNNIFFGSKKVILFDWESSWWSNNLLLDLGTDLANFYTRCFQRLELGERLIEEVRQSPFGKKPFFKKAIKIGMVVSVLQKISPMFKFGIYQKKYDQDHFNLLVKILRQSL